VKIRRPNAAVAAVASGALLLAGCSGPAQESEVDGSTSVTVGWNEPFGATNNLVADRNAATNGNVVYLTTSPFNYYDGDLNLVPNTGFGTYEVRSEDPLVVTYTVNEGVTWSDGTPVDAADMVLYWGALNDRFDTVAKEDVAQDADGGAVAGEGEVFFNSSSEAMTAVSEFPEVGDDGRSVTFTYDVPRSDWENGMTQPSPVAAHVVARRALGIEDPAEAKQALQDAFASDDADALARIAAVWNSDFSFTSLPDDPELYLSYGPYVITQFVENQFLTLERNERYDWGPEPTVDAITIRYSEDPLAAVTALQNGEVDLIAPQSSVDVLRTLEGIEGIDYRTAAEGAYEHLDLNFASGGPFDPASYGGDAEKARLVRRAFLKTVPRQEIVEKLVRPLQEDATTRDSFLYVPGSPPYERVVAENGSDAWAEVDIPGARALLEEAGVTTPVAVRLVYGKSNVRRADQFQLIQASAAEAGFTVLDEGSDTWSTRLDTERTSYDAALFGWQSTSTLIMNGESNYIPGGQNNFYGYDNPEVTALWTEASTNTDPAREVELAIEIERRLNEDAFGVNLFQHPGVVAHREALRGVDTIALSPTVFWNFWDWEIDAEDSLAAPSATESE
jgi:peptide/nickel transport system substrate-binding protein